MANKVQALEGGDWVLDIVINLIDDGTIVASKLVLTDIILTQSQVTNLVSDLALKATDSLVVHKAGDSLSGSLIFSSGTVTGLATPSASTDAATKNYVDGLITGLNWKSSVQAATTANITLSGTQTVDGISLIVGNRILVKNQSTTSQNGIYLVASGSWSRSSDADTAEKLNGLAVYVTDGTVNADTGWTETATITTIGSDPVIFAQFSGSGTYTNGAGLTLTGNIFSIVSNAITNSMLAGSISFSKLIGSDIVLAESQVTNLTSDLAARALDSAVVHNTGNETIAGTKTFSSTISGSISGNSATVTTNANLTGDVTSSGNATTLSNTAVSPGSYGSATNSPTYTVDSKGRFTASSSVTITPAFSSITSKPTTLSGYGITDALSNAAVGTPGTYSTVTTNSTAQVTAGTFFSESTATRTIQTVAAAANGWQLSSTRASMALYSIKIATGLNIQGDVVIEINPANTAVAAAWVEKGRVIQGQSGGISEPTQLGGGQIWCFVPPGYFVRIRSINVSGAPTYTYMSGQEVLY